MNAYQYAPNPVTWVDPWGLSSKDGCSVTQTSGVARVHHYEPDEQNRFGHYSVEVVSNENRAHTHQVITAPDHSSTTVVSATRYPANAPLKNTIEVPLENADAAIDYQKKQINKELGPYDRQNNSCVTHVCEVLRQGGEQVPSGPLQEYKYLKKRGAGI